MTGIRLIKKYPNRRLYDTEESRYVTLSEVRELVVRGIDFRVLDSQSEADLTRAILLQIILEQESGGHPLFTAEMLARFIRFYGDADQAAFTAFLERSLSAFQPRQHGEQRDNVLAGKPMDFRMRLGRPSPSLWREKEDASRRTAGLASDGKKQDKTP